MSAVAVQLWSSLHEGTVALPRLRCLAVELLVYCGCRQACRLTKQLRTDNLDDKLCNQANAAEMQPVLRLWASCDAAARMAAAGHPAAISPPCTGFAQVPLRSVGFAVARRCFRVVPEYA